MTTAIERRLAATRARILEVAQELLEERGYSGLAMRELAERAGISVPTVYNVVGGKPRVIETLAYQALEEIIGDLAEVSDEVDGLEAFLFAAFTKVREETAFAQALIRATTQEELFDVRDRLVGSASRHLGELLEIHVEGWVPGMDASRAAHIIVDALADLLQQWGAGALETGALIDAALVRGQLLLRGATSRPSEIDLSGPMGRLEGRRL